MGKVLGACDIPSLYALNHRHEEIKNLLGNPMEKIISAMGNVFYINDIAKAIAKDSANPLTRFAMQDFPEDGSNGMSQVFHGKELLHELLSPPAICMKGNIYFVDELLQEGLGRYFIPEHFFLGTPSTAIEACAGAPETK
ncbi:hypothetical protein PAXRUDRAFT_17930 [Paxillus rubicundulus Ve08.2h10]|uniref:Uncharacterized protein n=1 Tax=Paxillus rubicundulus Ve08.2h10 TaxID=930991 RepID=A0A0D0D8S1_9AGAM|nr:hypothetical protein PAXRUDRAFT_17930 [Paxillus rubicundulus Ve08.2h10]